MGVVVCERTLTVRHPFCHASKRWSGRASLRGLSVAMRQLNRRAGHSSFVQAENDRLRIARPDAGTPSWCNRCRLRRTRNTQNGERSAWCYRNSWRTDAKPLARCTYGRWSCEFRVAGCQCAAGCNDLRCDNCRLLLTLARTSAILPQGCRGIAWESWHCSHMETQ